MAVSTLTAPPAFLTEFQASRGAQCEPVLNDIGSKVCYLLNDFIKHYVRGGEANEEPVVT